MNEVTHTREDLQQILLAMAQQNKEFAADLARELRKPDPDTQAKQDAEKARAAKNKADFVEMVKNDEAAKQMRQNACPHRKDNGRFSTGGQVIGGRYALLLCSHCQKAWYKVFPPETLAQLNSGDLILFGADPTGWQDSPPAN